MIFIARCMALRITGSPIFLVMRSKNPAAVIELSTLTTRPVIIRPQVEALTINPLSSFKCFFQSATLILSRIRASAVALSGTRMSASAKLINKIPSWVSKLYSNNKESTILTALSLLRTCSTKLLVCSLMASRSLTPSLTCGSANGSKLPNHWSSSALYRGDINLNNSLAGRSINAGFNTSWAEN